MLQRTTVSSLPLEPRELIRKSWISNTVQLARSTFWWPDSVATFTLFFVLLAAITVAMIMHIHLSSQILQTRLQLDKLAAEYVAIERTNAEIVWQINQDVSLPVISERAQALGYVVATAQPHYIAAADLPRSALAVHAPALPANASRLATNPQTNNTANRPHTALAQSNALVSAAAAPAVQIIDAQLAPESVTPLYGAPPAGQFQTLLQNTRHRVQTWWSNILGD